ncbi:hypothetical protein SF83666_b66920 (plasmid) [Sinorhizobium fredii CCBAU 83666]|nr:hypothetical protein SF83666_b66920 [Sinorhizobium fredii CCBAU 83666]
MSRVVASNVCYRATAKITSMADMRARIADTPKMYPAC